MNIAFFSNYLNHHQLPLCIALDQLTEHQFTFVANTPIPVFRKQLGYQDMNDQYSFVLRAYESAEAHEQAVRIAQECDVVIFGATSEQYVETRMRCGKLTFRYTERIFKNGTQKAYRPRTIGSMLLYHTKYLFSPMYVLCASAYTKPDFQMYGAYLGKYFKWGYFPNVKRYPDVEALLREKQAASILWVGRMIGWKHPESIIYVAKQLKKDNIPFHAHMIGDGDMRMKLEQEIASQGLQDCVTILGAMTPEQVRAHMEKSKVFIFSSDRNEGWGAVLNEAMNSGCAVVASRAIGSVPFLIQDRENGMIFDENDWQQLYVCVKQLLSSEDECMKLGRKAYQSLISEWNPETAAERFVHTASCLLEKKLAPYATGPCSKA